MVHVNLPYPKRPVFMIPRLKLSKNTSPIRTCFGVITLFGDAFPGTQVSAEPRVYWTGESISRNFTARERLETIGSERTPVEFFID